MSNIIEIFTIIEQQNFGVRDSDNNFLFRDDINFVQESDSAKEFFVGQGLSVSMLLSGLLKMPIVPPPKKRKQTDLEESDKENTIPIKNLTLSEVADNL